MDTASQSQALDLPAIQALARTDMAAVDALIRRRLASDVVLINQVAEYIIGAGGKRQSGPQGFPGHRTCRTTKTVAMPVAMKTATAIRERTCSRARPQTP